MRFGGIDEIDNQIIDMLAENARASYSDIGERVGLSRTAVKSGDMRSCCQGFIGDICSYWNSRERCREMQNRCNRLLF